MNLKKIGKVFTSKFVGTGPSCYKKIIYRAAVSQRLRNTALVGLDLKISRSLPDTPHPTWLLRAAFRRDLWVTTQNTHKEQISTPAVGIEPTFPTSERLHTRFLDRTAIGIGCS